SGNKEKMCTNEISQQQEEGNGLNRGTPEHLAISDVSISMVTHYFDESFLRTEEDYVNTYSKSHLSDSTIVEDTIFSEEFAMIHA
ncbi:NADH:ubiquinone/plastoquinone oxidoreductase, chloroplast chain 5, C-terminal, partial [Melia azedarach]